MANKNTNVPYDQIPHIVINHPETNPEHWAIMICLFKVLKDSFAPIAYTNKSLAINCRTPLRTIERRIPELNKMGFIKCTGRGYNRRITLGLLFVNSATMAVGKLQPPNVNATTAKSDIHNRHSGGDSNHYSNHFSKEDFSFSNLNHWETKELELCVKMKVPLSSDYKYLQPLLDEALKNEKLSIGT